jgi:class 3 adenylate cyclase/pimeloyl-ACP methyl ester carboxylesterase
MRRPDVEFARAADGTYLAYQSFGAGPIEIFWQSDTFAMVDQLWDSPAERAWHEGLAEFARVTIYDKRGIGLSSRNVAPGNLETQVDDALTVLDAQGIERTVLGGFLEAGAPNALLAATHPSRVHSLVWIFPVPRTTVAPDFPWGMDQDYVDRDLEITKRWGTESWARDFIALNPDVMQGTWTTDEYVRFLITAARRTCTPDVARQLSLIWNETDVRGVLASIRAKTLLITADGDLGPPLAASVAAKIAHAEILVLPNLDSEIENFPAVHDAIRRFIGAGRPLVGVDSTLVSVLFTDIVDSTATQATLGDRAWNDVVAAHYTIVRAALTRWRGRENDTAGDGVYATFDGPARAVRCALEIVAQVRDLGIEVRAGVHTGECDLVDGKFTGIAVTTGARISALARPSQVLVSQTVKDLVAGSGLNLQLFAEHELKGVPGRWSIYAAID